MERTERMIKGYYKNKKRLDILLRKAETQRRRKERIRRDLKECNITIEVPSTSIGYSDEPTKTGGLPSSNIELALERSIDMLIRELEDTVKYSYRLESRIRELEEKIMDVEILLEDLEEEETRLLNLIYKEKKTYRYISHVINTHTGNVGKMKRRVVEKLKENVI